MSKPELYFDNRFRDAAPVASSTEDGFNVLNIIDARPYTWFKPAVMPANIDVNCGSVKQANYCVVYGHDLGTKGATLEVRGSADGFAASDDLLATITPANDKPFLLPFNSVGYQHWRTRLTGAAAPSLAIMIVGEALSFPKYLPNGFDPLGRKIVAQSNKSAKGHPLGIVIQYEEFDKTLQFKNLTWSWIRDTFIPAWDSDIKHLPFIFAWNPGDYPDELDLVTSTGKFSAPHRQGLFSDLSFSIEGVTS